MEDVAVTVVEELASGIVVEEVAMLAEVAFEEELADTALVPMAVDVVEGEAIKSDEVVVVAERPALLVLVPVDC